MTESQMQLATWTAKQASTLDFAKNSLPEPLRIKASSVVNDMHELAAALAEDRAIEIYCPEDAQ